MNTREEQRSNDRRDGREPDRWDLSRVGAVLPIGRLLGTELAISYSVFFGLAVCVGVAALLSQQEGNRDLVRTAMVSSTVWISGMTIQFFVAMAMAAISGLKIRACVIGLTGIEVPIHRWTADRAALLCVIVLQVLVTMGAVMWVLGWAGLSEGSASTNSGIGLGQAPSLGMKTADQIWQGSAWLIWIQAFCQIIPLPRTLGRLGMMSMISLANPSGNVASQVIWVRRVIQGFGFLLVIAALFMLTSAASATVPTWFVLAFFGGIVWVSGSHRDIANWLDAFAMTRSSAGRVDTCPTLGEEARRWFVDRRNLKRMQVARDREQSEAVDVARLDSILQRVQEHGLDAISEDERAVLRRVSDTLREHRRNEPEN